MRVQGGLDLPDNRYSVIKRLTETFTGEKTSPAVSTMNNLAHYLRHQVETRDVLLHLCLDAPQGNWVMALKTWGPQRRRSPATVLLCCLRLSMRTAVVGAVHAHLRCPDI